MTLEIGLRRMDTFGWWLGVAVTGFIRSTKLLYAKPSTYFDGWLPAGR